MHEVFSQVFSNLRANKLRSFLTMFGILWGVISVVVLSATGEGFRRGNQQVLEELGKNVVIVWGGRTAMQAGGERAGRRIFLTEDDARALARESNMIGVVSAELQRGGIQIKSSFNAATLTVHGVEPQYQDIRTIDIEDGRPLRFSDEERAHRVALIGADAAAQLFGTRERLGQTIHLNGIPYGVVGIIRKKDQDSSYSGPDNDKVFVPYAAMAKDFPRTDANPGVVSQVLLAPHAWVLEGLPQALNDRTGRVEDIKWPLELEVRRILSRRHACSGAWSRG
jgi:putative ABC transport system permease protein